MPILMSIPIALEETGMEKTGLAGGFIATLELF